MRALIFHILMILFLAAPAVPAQAQTAKGKGWCQPTRVPAVTIRTDAQRIKWDYSRSKKKLNHADIDTVNPYGNQVITDVGGLMHGGIKMEEQMQFGSLYNPNNKESCMYYDKIAVSLHIYPTIYIASEYKPGSCMFNAIRAHELKHINVDREIVNKYAKLMGQVIQKEIAARNVYGPVPGPKEPLQAQMKNRMQAIMTQYSAAMDGERRQRQQAVDSLKEYERVNHLCPGQR